METSVTEIFHGCLAGKDLKFPPTKWQVEKPISDCPLFWIHADLAFFPTEYKCRLGFIGALIFVDEKAHAGWAYLINKKLETLSKFQMFLDDATQGVGIYCLSVPSLHDPACVQCFHSDNGGEFTSKAFIEFCCCANIQIENSTAVEGHTFIAE